MIDSCTNRCRKTECSGRKPGFIIRSRLAVLVAGLGLMTYASFAAVPVAGADNSDPVRGINLDRIHAPSEQTSQPGITSPTTGSIVSGSVPVLGTAAGSPCARYELYVKREPSGDEGYIWFAGDTRPVQNGQLGVWQTGGLAPGIYTLRLRVVRPDGNYGEFYAQNISVNQEAPTPTPDGPTPTPIPIDTPTPFPQPTVEPVQVEQPNLEEPTAEPTPTAAPGAQSNGGGTDDGQASSTSQSVIQQTPGVLGGLGEALSLNRMRARFLTGVRWSAGLFLLLGAIFAAKRLLVWVIAKVD